MPAPARFRRRAAALAAALISCAAAAPAGAATLPVGEADGVRIEPARSGLVVDFTKRAAPLYKRIAGKRVEIECTRIATGGGFGISAGDSSGAMSMRAPKARTPLRTGQTTRGDDFCRVWLASRTTRRGSSSRQLIVSIPLTQKGAVRLDEERTATMMLSVLVFAGELADTRRPPVYPTPAQLVERLQARFRAARRSVVALDSADATPPADTVGYWSDGAGHVAVVALSAQGRRLFAEFAPDDVVSTNVAQFFAGM